MFFLFGRVFFLVFLGLALEGVNAEVDGFLKCVAGLFGMEAAAGGADAYLHFLVHGGLGLDKFQHHFG